MNNVHKTTKISKFIKKIFIFFIITLFPFPLNPFRSGKIYAYNKLSQKKKNPYKNGSDSNPKKKESSPENNEKEAYYNKLYNNIKTELQDLYENPSSTIALKHMVWVEIPVWRLKDGKKVPDKEKIQVLNLLAEEVKDIFIEIYNGKEKFPIKYVHGYSWRGNGLKSLHSRGCAIDINPNENPQVTSEGKVLVGEKWEPGKNPYSITADGDVVKAFQKRKWIWGAYFKTKDYMHFGFMEM